MREIGLAIPWDHSGIGLRSEIGHNVAKHRWTQCPHKSAKAEANIMYNPLLDAL
jgi:hypothetical protein